MFLALLIVTFVLSVLVSGITAWSFRKPVDRTLDRIVGPEMGASWKQYILFAIFVVGISGGVRVWTWEKYLSPAEGNQIVLDANRWTLEIYQSIIGSLQGIAWMLLVFFVFALVAFVIVRSKEAKSD